MDFVGRDLSPPNFDIPRSALTAPYPPTSFAYNVEPGRFCLFVVCVLPLFDDALRSRLWDPQHFLNLAVSETSRMRFDNLCPLASGRLATAAIGISGHGW